jgi:hypothetical protein
MKGTKFCGGEFIPTTGDDSAFSSFGLGLLDRASSDRR